MGGADAGTGSAQADDRSGDAGGTDEMGVTVIRILKCDDDGIVIKDELRDCENCTHYTTINGESGCMEWDCEYEPKTTDHTEPMTAVMQNALKQSIHSASYEIGYQVGYDKGHHYGEAETIKAVLEIIDKADEEYELWALKFQKVRDGVLALKSGEQG